MEHQCIALHRASFQNPKIDQVKKVNPRVLEVKFAIFSKFGLTFGLFYYSIMFAKLKNGRVDAFQCPKLSNLAKIATLITVF